MQSDVAAPDQIATAVTHALRAFPGAKVTTEFVAILVNELTKTNPTVSDLDRMKDDLIINFKFMPSVSEFLSVIEGYRDAPNRMSERALMQKIANDRRLFQECGLTQLKLVEMRKSGMTHDEIVDHCKGMEDTLQIAYLKKNKGLSPDTQAKLDAFKAQVTAFDTPDPDSPEAVAKRERLLSTQCASGEAILNSELYKSRRPKPESDPT